MNCWIICWIVLLLSYILLVPLVYTESYRNIKSSVCSLEDIKARLRESCSGPNLESSETFRKKRRRKRSYVDGRLSANPPKPRYYFRVKREQVNVICCTPVLIPTHGHRCIEYYNC